MKIGIDISQIVHQGTGVARFTEGLVNAILDYDSDNRWTFLFYSLRKNMDPRIEKKIRSKGHTLIKWKLPPTFASFLFNDLHELSKILTSNIKHLTPLDWFITSDWVELSLPLKKATIIHDLVYLRYPETVHERIVSTQKKRLAWVKRESKIIFADSKSTKDDVIHFMGIENRKIIVNYPGVEIEVPTPEETELVIRKYKLTKPFILSVGKIEPRKNLDRLIAAFEKIATKEINLVIVGPDGWGGTDRNFTALLHKQVQFLGYVGDEDLFALYRSCLCFVYPSLWEGFGYPVVEAMKLKVPVATANTSSLKEIGLDAALLFDPRKVEEIAKNMSRLWHEEKLRNELALKGFERSKIYTWKTYYEKMIEALKSNS